MLQADNTHFDLPFMMWMTGWAGTGVWHHMRHGYLEEGHVGADARNRSTVEAVQNGSGV